METDIETLAQRIGSLTGAIHSQPEDVKFWFDMKAGLVAEMVRINHDLDKLLIEKVIK